MVRLALPTIQEELLLVQVEVEVADVFFVSIVIHMVKIPLALRLASWMEGVKFSGDGNPEAQKKDREDKKVATCSFQGRSFEQRLQYPMYPSVHFLNCNWFIGESRNRKTKPYFFGGGWYTNRKNKDPKA